jgi:hypothetical protein
MKFRNTLLLVLPLLLAITACRANEPKTLDDDSEVIMSLSVAPNPPQVGNATLVLSLVDDEGQPIDDAKVNIRGDMNHAGMQPVLRESSTGRDGDYQIPFEWTMGGDWFVVVTAELPDGHIAEREFEFTVDGEGMMEIEDSEMSIPTEEASSN